MSDSDSEHEYELVMPLVCCKSNGGVYEDESFCAGSRYGTDSQMLASTSPIEEFLCYISPGMQAQYDLLAMHHNRAVKFEPWNQHPDEWVLATFSPITITEGGPS